MIEINLLPPEHRPVERTPLPRLLTILAGVLLSAVGLVTWFWLWQVAVPRAEQRCQSEKAEMDRVKKVAEKVQQIERELQAAKDREGVLGELFDQRISWARILDRLAEARAQVKAGEDVVLTRVEMKKAAGTAVGGRPGAEVRQLNLQGFVATDRKEAQDNELRETYLAFVRALRSDSEFKQEFECDEKGDGNAKCTYVGDQMVDVSSTGKGGKAAKDIKDLPKAKLSFEVAFKFKSPPAPPPPAPKAAGAGAATAKK